MDTSKHCSEPAKAASAPEGPQVEVKTGASNEKKRKRRKGVQLPPFCVTDGKPGEPFNLVKYLGSQT